MGSLQIKRALLVIAGAALGVYGADWAPYAAGKRQGGGVLSSVEVERYFAVRMKDGKTEYMFDQPGTVTCTESLFPHGGYAPCWYVRRNARQRIDM